jgi:hypothetical protein
MSRRHTNTISTLSVIALVVAALTSKPAAATTIDIYEPIAFASPLNTFFADQGYTVTQLTSSFTSLSGANFVILPGPVGLSAGQISLVDAYVNGGGRLLLNSDYGPQDDLGIAAVNTVLMSLGSSIVNQSTSSNPGYYDTSDIVVNPFTTGVADVNYADTSSLTGGTALVFGNPVTDLGQEFIAYQTIGAGYVFVIADTNVQVNISSTTTNNNGVLYCNFGGLGCAATAVSPLPAPEPNILLMFGTGMLGIAVAVRRRFFA